MRLSVLSPALKPLLTSLTLIFQAAGCKVQGKTSRYDVCMARQHRGWGIGSMKVSAYVGEGNCIWGRRRGRPIMGRERRPALLT